MQKILIVEDDEKLRNELKIFLNHNGYKCEALEEFGDTENDILKCAPDLLLLDVNLPNSNGQYICKELRKKIDIPIIIITSRNNDIDELISLNYGADHYVTKPFNIQILLARISSLLRRTTGSSSDLISGDGFTLNIAKSTICAGEKSAELTKNELRILRCLLQNKDKIVSRETIMQYLWEDDSFVDDNTLTVNINRLRKKLSELSLSDLIKTRRGQGYYI